MSKATQIIQTRQAKGQKVVHAVHARQSPRPDQAKGSSRARAAHLHRAIEHRPGPPRNGRTFRAQTEDDEPAAAECFRGSAQWLLNGRQRCREQRAPITQRGQHGVGFWPNPVPGRHVASLCWRAGRATLSNHIMLGSPTAQDKAGGGQSCCAGSTTPQARARDLRGARRRGRAAGTPPPWRCSRWIVRAMARRRNGGGFGGARHPLRTTAAAGVCACG